MRFGKYAGRIFQDVAANEPGYARWCCGQETLSESFTVSVQSEEVHLQSADVICIDTEEKTQACWNSARGYLT